MTFVKPLYDETLDLDDYEPKHLAYLLEQSTLRMQHDMARLPGADELRRRHAPLRPSHFRVLSLVPVDGARLTDLARPAGMTKQALGQLFDPIIEHGYAVARRLPSDGRVRIVKRTRKGDRLVADVDAMFERLRDHYRDQLGARRCDQLFDLLTQLATGWDR
jgi:DNA-binding MarR family transcriptional regulator